MYRIIGILIAVIIATGLGWFIYSDLRINVPPEDDISQNDKIITKDSISITLSEEDSIEDVEIKQMPVDKIVKQELIYPDLDHTLVFPDSFSEDVRVIIQNNVATLTAQLIEDPSSFQNWLDLAIQYKIIEDYEGARNIWEFLNEAFPGNSISFNNLGDLYHYYLKDFPSSEKNFRAAIARNKGNTQSYAGLHELYKYSYKQDTTAAVDILLEGIAENPKNTDLLVTLAVYYKEKNDAVNAKKYYRQARDEAQKLGNTQLVELLDEEISKL